MSDVTASITLVRHGRSALHVPKQVASDALRRTARRYNEAGIRRTPRPPMELCRHAHSAAVIVCSDTRRAIESARALDGTREPLVDPVFREAGLPLSLPVPLSLSFDAWIVMGRIAWFLGWSAGGESLTEARRRASTAARRLTKLCAQHRSVMLVGHGVFNALIAAELRRKGWSGPLWSPRTPHWAFACYSKPRV
ncbi:MAG TPA: histidine phosphatase family protein [Candidatus Margulisiibacteriota bacterium]|nr:histidine phosphatase family protein [Candidatus Margulisiibacteriota bacterium]